MSRSSRSTWRIWFWSVFGSVIGALVLAQGARTEAEVMVIVLLLLILIVMITVFAMIDAH